MANRNKLQPMTEITQELENVLQKMTDPKGHDMQWGEVKAQVDIWLEVHAPHAEENYVDGTIPINLYGHIDYVTKKLKKILALRK